MQYIIYNIIKYKTITTNDSYYTYTKIVCVYETSVFNIHIIIYNIFHEVNTWLMVINLLYLLYQPRSNQTRYALKNIL